MNEEENKQFKDKYRPKLQSMVDKYIDNYKKKLIQKLKQLEKPSILYHDGPDYEKVIAYNQGINNAIVLLKKTNHQAVIN